MKRNGSKSCLDKRGVQEAVSHRLAAMTCAIFEMVPRLQNVSWEVERRGHLTEGTKWDREEGWCAEEHWTIRESVGVGHFLVKKVYMLKTYETSNRQRNMRHHLL